MANDIAQAMNEDQRHEAQLREDHAREAALAGQVVPPSVFREAMSRLGAAVHVITTAGPAGPQGVTATAVCSVSDQPATLLVCVHHLSRTTPAIQQNGVLCVNTLCAADEQVADVFAGRIAVDDRFSTAQWITLATGAPVLASAVVAFDCRVVDVRPVATHNVFIANVAAVHYGEGGASLLYHERAYKSV